MEEEEEVDILSLLERAQDNQLRDIALQGFRLHDHGLARTALDILLARPHDPDFYHQDLTWLGACLDHLQERYLALVVLTKAISTRPKHAEAWINRGSSKNALKLFQEAHDDISTGLQCLGDSRDDGMRSFALCERGFANYHMKRFQAAFDDYDEAVRLGDLEARIHRGHMRHLLGEYALAREDYQEGLERGFAPPVRHSDRSLVSRTHLRLSFVGCHFGDVDFAARRIIDSYDFDPSFPRFSEYLNVFETAAGDLNSCLLRMDPRRHLALFQLKELLDEYEAERSETLAVSLAERLVFVSESDAGRPSCNVVLVPRERGSVRIILETYSSFLLIILNGNLV